MTSTWSTWTYLADGPWGLLLVAVIALWVAWERTQRRKEADSES